MSEILVVGWGNPLRADDGLGCHVARQIRQHFKNDPRVEIAPCHQLGPELADRLADAAFVVFVDACAQGTPGTITERAIEPERQFSGDFGQHLTPGVLLAAAKTLHGKAPDAVMFTMAGWCFEFGERMSPVVMNHYAELVARITKVIEQRERELVVQ